MCSADAAIKRLLLLTIGPVSPPAALPPPKPLIPPRRSPGHFLPSSLPSYPYVLTLATDAPATHALRLVVVSHLRAYRRTSRRRPPSPLPPPLRFLPVLGPHTARVPCGNYVPGNSGRCPSQPSSRAARRFVSWDAAPAAGCYRELRFWPLSLRCRCEENTTTFGCKARQPSVLASSSYRCSGESDRPREQMRTRG
ncbi:hypothetical protein C8R45DRAFT_162575 [Mycena sanguinolenta]|nr:hypothetical protein C8R45DRAFT_162575 [Mycena sanguinolenta]